MKRSFTLKHNIRKSFGKIPDLVNMPNLLEIQRNSYELFLQKDVKPEEIQPFIVSAVDQIKDNDLKKILQVILE